jgi:hypothetical protein
MAASGRGRRNPRASGEAPKAHAALGLARTAHAARGLFAALPAPPARSSIARLIAALAIAFAAATAMAGTAFAADPGIWLKTTQLTGSPDYRQGLASNPATGDVFFSGPFAGIYRTRNGRQVAASTNPIPSDVSQREQYNHIGDIAFDPAAGGRLLLPLESYQPFQPDQNPSKTGSIAVMDAKTLKWSYYVKLDPGEIQKAQWVATDPSGLVWTITGHDLLAYNLSDLNPANAAPTAPPIHSVRRLVGAAPNGTGGAVVYGGRIYLSTQADGTDAVVSVDPNTGASRVEIEIAATAEPEGLDIGPYMGGLLHWEVVPGGGLGSTEILSFVPKGAHLRLTLHPSHVRAGRKTTVTGNVRVLAGRFAIPLPGARVRLGGKSARTDARGRARLAVTLTRGLHRARALYKGLRPAARTIRAYRAFNTQGPQGLLSDASVTCLPLLSLRTTLSDDAVASTCA